MTTESSPHRILVVANETCPCEELQREVDDRARERDAAVLIVAPALNRRLKRWVSDTDEAVERARERLATIVGNLEAHGIDARGEVGDAQPLQAIDDALSQFPADELILSTHPPGRSHWLEKGLLDRVPEHFDGPITHFVSAYGAGQAIGSGDGEAASG